MEMSLPPDKRTGKLRVLRYDEGGYDLLVGDRVAMSRRLEAVCYLVSGRDRERIALIHGLQDAGEFRLARHMAGKRLHSHS
jgi:hypothetical protein